MKTITANIIIWCSSSMCIGALFLNKCFLLENNYSKKPLFDIHNIRNIHILDLICFFRPLGSMRGSGFPKERLYWGALPTLPLHLLLDIHFTFTTCLTNQIKISDSESADAFFISWCQGVKLSWPLPVWSHRHLSVRRMAISGGEDVFGGGHDDGGPCDHDCHGNGEIVKLNGLELSPPQCCLWNGMYPNISM